MGAASATPAAARSALRVVVIGGGAMGAAVALFLKRIAGAAVDVRVVEPDPGLALASSARSAASIRQQFSNAVNVRMSQFGWQLIDQPAEWLAVAGEVPALGLVRSGYLFLATSREGAAALHAQQAMQQAEGAPVQPLSAAAAGRAFGWLNTTDLTGANLGHGGEGWFDGYAFARALAAKARALGAHWVRDRVVGGALAGAAGTAATGRALTAVQLGDGTRLAADAFVLAAGPWSGHVGRALGLAVPVHARRRTVFMLSCPAQRNPPPPPTPLVVDPSGVWFRSEGAGYLAGWSPAAGDHDPDDLPLDQPDLAQFDDKVWPALAHRVPAFEALRATAAWDGYYEVHPLDHNALIGPHPDCANLLLCTGFSGHGLQHAPAAGRGIAEWLLTGGWQTLDLSAFSPARVADQCAFREHAII